MTVEERVQRVMVGHARGDIDDALFQDLLDRLAERRATPPHPVLSSYADALVTATDAATALPVHVCAAPIPQAMIPQNAMLHELLYGFDRTAAQEATDGLRDARRAAASEAHAELASLMPESAAFTPDTSRPCLASRLRPPEIRTLQQAPTVKTIYVGIEAESSADPEAGGTATRQGIQAQIYLDSDDVGGIAPTKLNAYSRLTVAVSDEGMNEEHRALRDTTSGTRVVGKYTCASGTPCSSTLSLSPGSQNHGTKVLGVIAGDLTDGQDANWTSSADRQERSGYANEVGVVLLDGYGANATRRATEQATDLAVDVMNISSGVDEDTCVDFDVSKNNFTQDAKCRGDSTLLKDEINLAYNDGIFVVKSAGNDGPATTNCTCTVTSPGDAEGAFAVAALDEACSSGSHATVRARTIASYSAEGGGELGGFTGTTRERTVIGLAAPSEHHSLASCTASSTCNTSSLSEYACTGSGTSFAAPVVAAAAIMFKDRWISWGSPTTWLDDAGNMRVQMLLMGDRLDNDGSTKRTTRYSTKYGAGRLKMRHRSDAGMDAPWLSRSGSVVLGDGETFQRWVSSDATAQPLDSDVNMILAVAWWFEPGTVSLAAAMDLEVDKFQSNCITYVSGVVDASADTRKRVFRNDVAGTCLRLEINAFDVPVGETRRVFWAYYYEDTDRDDVNGPTLSSPIGPNDVELP